MIRDQVEETCCQCGMERSHWQDKNGYRMDGDRFCCVACAQETGCRCEEALRQARAAKKPIKAPRGAPKSFQRPARKA
jgi:hypothetical protein